MFLEPSKDSEFWWKSPIKVYSIYLKVCLNSPFPHVQLYHEHCKYRIINFPTQIYGKSLDISSSQSPWMGQSYFESLYLCHHHNIRVPSQGGTLTEKRRPSMTKKGIKSCSCWHMLNWAPKRAKIKWKAIEKALAAGVSISKQSIQKHVSWAGKILLLVFWERSGKCTILLTTPSIIPARKSLSN